MMSVMSVIERWRGREILLYQENLCEFVNPLRNIEHRTRHQKPYGYLQQHVHSNLRQQFWAICNHMYLFVSIVDNLIKKLSQSLCSRPNHHTVLFVNLWPFLFFKICKKNVTVHWPFTFFYVWIFIANSCRYLER